MSPQDRQGLPNASDVGLWGPNAEESGSSNDDSSDEIIQFDDRGPGLTKRPSKSITPMQTTRWRSSSEGSGLGRDCTSQLQSGPELKTRGHTSANRETLFAALTNRF